MPGEKTPSEYYRYYCASQERVELWVQDTKQQVLLSPNHTDGGRRLERGLDLDGSLLDAEEAGLATPISLVAPIRATVDKGKSKAVEPLETKSKHDRRRHSYSPERDLDPGPSRERHRKDDLDDSSRRHHRKSSRNLQDPSSSRSRSRPATSSKRTLAPTTAVTDGNDDLDLARSTSKHSKRSKESKLSKESKDSKRSRHTIETRHSKSSSRRHRDRHSSGAIIDTPSPAAVLSYIPYGIVPLLLAATAGTSGASLAAASCIMLASYVWLDQNQESRPSSKRT